MRMNLHHTLSLSTVALVASIAAGQALAQDPNRAATTVSRDPGHDGPSAPVPDFRPYVQMPLAAVPGMPALSPGDPTADRDALMDLLVGTLQTGVGAGTPSGPLTLVGNDGPPGISPLLHEGCSYAPSTKKSICIVWDCEQDDPPANCKPYAWYCVDQYGNSCGGGGLE